MADPLPGPLQSPSPRRGLVKRFAGLVAGVVFLVAFGLAGLTWIVVSSPYDPTQVATDRAHADQSIANLAETALPADPRGIITLTYHAVDDNEPANSYTFTRATFAAHMAALHAAGYHTIRLSDVERVVNHEPVTLPSKPLLLTFDDGVATDWLTVDPVLAEYHFTAVAFIITGRMARPGEPSYYLTTRQLQQLQATGRWEFGAHTNNLHDRQPIPGGIGPALNNFILINGREETPSEYQIRVGTDLARNQAVLRDLLGQPATAFAYPFGDSDATHKSPAASALLLGIFRQNGLDFAFEDGNPPSGHVDAIGPWSDRFGLPRIPLSNGVTVGELMNLIRAATPTLLPSQLVGLPWTGDHATCTSNPPGTPPAVIVSGAGYGTCGLPVNTSQWVDYELTARLVAVSRRASAVIGLRDGTGTSHDGRLEVVVGESYVVLREALHGGIQRTLATIPLAPDPTGKGNRDVDIRIQQNRIVVTVSGAPEINATFDSQLSEGGIVFGTAGTGQYATIIESPTLGPVQNMPTGSR